jgi:pimeloyl-ACP methyl ester carboxylesterase
MPFESTPTLKIAYEAGGPSNGFPVVLLHGWPDDVRTYDRVVPVLNAAGFRTVVPYLRGFGDTSFLSKETMRSGEIVAMAQDSLDLADALNLQKIRSDWPRLGFTYCLRFGDCHSSAHLPDCDPSVGWQPGELPTPSLKQAQAYWYQWFMTTKRGRQVVRSNGKAFARTQWENWSPSGWFSDDDFERTAKSFEKSGLA